MIKFLLSQRTRDCVQVKTHIQQFFLGSYLVLHSVGLYRMFRLQNLRGSRTFHTET